MYKKLKEVDNDDFREKSTSFVKKSSEYQELVLEYRELLLDIISNITSRKKIYCNDKITLRDEDIFLFNKTEKANLRRLFADDEVSETLGEFIKNKELNNKFKEARENFNENNNNIGHNIVLLSNNIFDTGIFYLQKLQKEHFLAVRVNKPEEISFFEFKNRSKNDVYNSLETEYSIDSYKSAIASNNTETHLYYLKYNMDKVINLLDEANKKMQSKIEFLKEEIKRIKKEFKVVIVTNSLI
jgi:hypothetical protein